MHGGRGGACGLERVQTRPPALDRPQACTVLCLDTVAAIVRASWRPATMRGRLRAHASGECPGIEADPDRHPKRQRHRACI